MVEISRDASPTTVCEHRVNNRQQNSSTIGVRGNTGDVRLRSYCIHFAFFSEENGKPFKGSE